jgi:hypothetical protein
MTTPTSNTEWPSPAMAEPVKALINNAFEIADSKTEDSGKRMAQEIFSPIGQMVVNKQKFTGWNGMYHKAEVHVLVSPPRTQHDAMVADCCS